MLKILPQDCQCLEVGTYRTGKQWVEAVCWDSKRSKWVYNEPVEELVSTLGPDAAIPEVGGYVTSVTILGNGNRCIRFYQPLTAPLFEVCN